MAKVLKEEVFRTLPAVQVNEEEITKELLKELQEFHKKSSFSMMILREHRQCTIFPYIRNGRKMP